MSLTSPTPSAGAATAVRVVRDRLRRLREHAVEEETPAWALAPALPPQRPGLTVAMAVSARLATGLDDQWHARALTAETPSAAGADLLLVELCDLAVPGFGRADEPRVVDLLQAARAAEVPVVVWITRGRPPAGQADVAALRRLLALADHVFVAGGERLLGVWGALVPVEPLLPAARTQRPPRTIGSTPTPGFSAVPEAASPAERRALVVSTGPSDPEVAGPVATVLGPALRSLAPRTDVRLQEVAIPPRGVLPNPLSRLAQPADHAGVVEAIEHAAVLVDVPRRTVDDTWIPLEAMALGTPVISLAGLPQPEGVDVLAPADRAGLRAEVVALLNQPELADREALLLRRSVLRAHTFGHRARTLLAAVGRPAEEFREPQPPTISAIVPTNRLHELDNVLANIARQQHPRVELVLVLHGLAVDEADLRARAKEAGVEQLEIVAADASLTLGACMNLGIDASSGELIAKMDDDNHYGPHYLGDLAAELRAQGAGIAGKWGHYVWLRSTGAVVLRYPEFEHSWVRRIQGGAMLFDGDVARGLRFGDLPRAVDSDILDRAIADGVSIWSADRFNFVSVRGEDRAAHTWTVEDASFLTAAGRLAFYGDPRPHVEV